MRILHARDAAAAEHHLVLCERAGLVGEDILDLAQILCDVQCPALDSGGQAPTVEVNVILDEVYLSQLDDLDGNVEGDGNQHLLGGRL